MYQECVSSLPSLVVERSQIYFRMIDTSSKIGLITIGQSKTKYKVIPLNVRSVQNQIKRKIIFSYSKDQEIIAGR